MSKHNKCTNENYCYRESDLLHEAIEYATLAHRNQMRKGTEIPYIVHPIEVAQILSAIGCRKEVIIAGLLHDTVEDTSTTIDEIKRAFGTNVARLVASCSEDKTKSWEERKKHTISYLANEKDYDVLALVCADKLSNLRSIKADHNKFGNKLWTRFNRGKEKQKWYFNELLDSLRELQGIAMYEELKNLHNIVFM